MERISLAARCGGAGLAPSINVGVETTLCTEICHVCVQSNHTLHLVCCVLFWELAVKPAWVLEGVVGAAG